MPNYKYYLLDAINDKRYKYAIKDVTPSIKLYEKNGKNNKLVSVILSDTRLKPGLLRFGVYRDKKSTVEDFLLEDYEKLSISTFLRPIITVQIVLVLLI